MINFQNDKEDILSRFLVESTRNPEKMDDQYLRDIILNFMIAGKDTSANTLSWFIYMLCKNPLIQEQIAQEVRNVTGSLDDGANVDEFMANITDATLDRMHLLHAALTETLRLYPAVPTVIINPKSLLIINFDICLATPKRWLGWHANLGPWGGRTPPLDVFGGGRAPSPATFRGWGRWPGTLKRVAVQPVVTPLQFLNNFLSFMYLYF